MTSAFFALGGIAAGPTWNAKSRSRSFRLTFGEADTTTGHVPLCKPARNPRQARQEAETWPERPGRAPHPTSRVGPQPTTLAASVPPPGAPRCDANVNLVELLVHSPPVRTEPTPRPGRTRCDDSRKASGGPWPAAESPARPETLPLVSRSEELVPCIGTLLSSALEWPRGKSPGRAPPVRPADLLRRRHGLADLGGRPAPALPGGGEHPRARRRPLAPPRLHQRRRRADRDEHVRREPAQARRSLPRGRDRADQLRRRQDRARGETGLGPAGADRRRDRPARRPRRRRGRPRRAVRRAGGAPRGSRASTCSSSRRSTTSASSRRRSPPCAASPRSRSSRS